MEKRFVETTSAPAPVGPYSQAVAIGDLLFLAGQIALDPETGKIVGQDVAAQTRQVLTNLQAVLTEAGASADDVVKTTVYLCDISLFSEMNAVYEEVFGNARPARTTIGIASLPLGALVEIDAIAVLPGA